MTRLLHQKNKKNPENYNFEIAGIFSDFRQKILEPVLGQRDRRRANNGTHHMARAA